MHDYLIVLGATATGKSGAASALAEQVGGEIVNADAFQMYRGLDVGTATPPAEEMARVPHHLFGILDPRRSCSAGSYAERAAGVVEEIHGRGRLPIVVGGTGLYVRALAEGLSPVPATPREVRSRYRGRLRSEGAAALRRELERLDPATARRLQPADAQRTVRALEVLELTGVGLTEWWLGTRRAFTALRPRKVGLTLSKPLLYDRVRERVRTMIEKGWVEEVRSLLSRDIPPQAPAFRAIGYRRLVEYLRGAVGLETTIEAIERDTRQYAKRQTTWFRREPGVEWVEGPEACLATFLESAED